MTCECVRCASCKGSGSVWFSFDKKYLGTHRRDDLDELETCEDCGGSGIDSECEECRELAEEDENRAYQAELDARQRQDA